MKITVLANRDLASNLALNQLLPLLYPQHELRVHLSSQVGSGGDLPEPLRLLKFFEQTLFNDILWPALDQAQEPHSPCSFAGLSQFTVTPISVLNKINSESGLVTLNSGEPDLVISIRYGGILKERAIAIPRHGVINLHSGLLPDYRGVMATFRALLKGETEIGTTVHYISDANIDTGNIIGNTLMPVSPGRSYLWHVLQLYPQACTLLAQIVEEISDGSTPAGQPQPAGGNYYTFPDQAELEEFIHAGHSLYDVDDITAITSAYLGSTTD